MIDKVGIAILSTDRPECLDRLLKSIYKHSRYTRYKRYIFVIDDSTNPEMTKKVCSQYRMIKFIHTGERIGIANNTNYALEALSKYEYGLIMNNDMEIINESWELFYPTEMKLTGIHHFCFQQEGLWGAGTHKRPETITEIGTSIIKTIHDYPQGALLAYDRLAFATAGYFDSKTFVGYGKSHWMWSFSISESGIQPKGIHDVVGSNSIFKVHDEPCTTPYQERIEAYRRNTIIFKEELDKLKNGSRPIYTPLRINK